MKPIRVGCAGWPLSPDPRFDGEGSHLERYARVLDVAELNSTFYRQHKPETFARWAASVPASFRFTAKAPRAITHELCFAGCRAVLDSFLAGVTLLGPKLGVLLVQTAKSLALDPRAVGRFFALLRASWSGPVVVEPRHPSWFDGRADDLLARHDVDRVLADPPVVPFAFAPRTVAYLRLHGSPRMYWSPYDAGALDRIADRAAELARRVPVWVVFDNTASGAAPNDALAVVDRLETRRLKVGRRTRSSAAARGGSAPRSS